jgi:large subunit ribosomal protein L25
MNAIQLQATKREGDAPAIREQGNIPAVVYGPHIDAFSVSVPYLSFEKIYQTGGESRLIDLAVEGQDSVAVLVKDMQIHPVSRKIMHVDFRNVTMGEKMDVTVELQFDGVAPAEKQLGGTLILSTRSLNVSCLPKDLVDHIAVDLSVLISFDQQIYIKDIQLPEGLTVLDAQDALVAKVTPPLTEEQLKAMEETEQEDVAAVAVEGEEIKDAEAGETPITPAEEKPAEEAKE